MTLIEKAMQRAYGSAVDITEEWAKMTPEQRQTACINGLHIETDRSGRRILGTASQRFREDSLRAKVIALQSDKSDLVKALKNAHCCATLRPDGTCAGCPISEAIAKAQGD